MTLVVIVICILSERFLIHQLSLKRFYWFNHYVAKMKPYINAHVVIQEQPWLQLLLLLLPLVVAVASVLWLVSDVFFGLFSLVFNIIIFCYCLGPNNVFYPQAQKGGFSASDYFVHAEEQLFSVILWYIIGGPIAIVIYRGLSLLKNDEQVGSLAGKIYDILRWPSVRIVALLYMLVGHFQEGMNVLKQSILLSPEYNDVLLRETSTAAAQLQSKGSQSMADAESFVNQALMVYLFLLALFTLAAMI